MIWHVLRTEPQREATAAGHLIGRRFDVYLPMVRGEIRRGKLRVRTPVERPMMPGYLFALLDPASGCWDRVRSAPGVLDFLHLEHRPATLSEHAIAAVRQIEEAEHDRRETGTKWPFRIGDVVRVGEPGGAMRGVIGVLQSLDRSDKAVLEVVSPSRAWRFDTPAAWLEAV